MNNGTTSAPINAILQHIIDKLALAEHQSMLMELYTPILLQYIKICNENHLVWNSEAVDADFDFWELLKRSMLFSVKAAPVKDQMRCLNMLAEEWDSKIAQKSNPAFVRSHVFFLCDCNEQTHVELFMRTAPPDIRLICILINNEDSKHPARAFHKMLHEVGHYIGLRNRQDRIKPFAASVAYELCNQIYLHYMKIALNTFSVKDNQPAIEDDKYITPWIKELSFDIRSVLQKSHKKIHDELNTQCKNNTKAMEYEASKYAAWSESQRTQAIIAIRRGYFNFLTPIMYESVCAVLDKLTSSLLNYSELDASSVSYNFIEAHKSKVIERIRDEISNAESTWIDNCEKQFTEPIADLFMIKLSGLSMRKYIHLLLSSAYTSWYSNPNKQYEFIHYLSDDTFLPRIISVLLNVYSDQIGHPTKKNGIFSKCAKFKAIGLAQLKLSKRACAISNAYDLVYGIIESYFLFNKKFISHDSTKAQNIYNPVFRTQGYFSKLMRSNAYWNRFADSKAASHSFQALVFPYLKPAFLIPFWKTALGKRIIHRLID